MYGFLGDAVMNDFIHFQKDFAAPENFNFLIYTHREFTFGMDDGKIVSASCYVSADRSKTVDITNGAEREIQFTYSIKWFKDSSHSTFAQPRSMEINWLYINNACVLVTFLMALLAIIFMRILKKDFARCKKEEGENADADADADADVVTNIDADIEAKGQLKGDGNGEGAGEVDALYTRQRRSRSGTQHTHPPPPKVRQHPKEKNRDGDPPPKKKKKGIPSTKDLFVPFRAIRRIMKLDKDIGTMQNEAAMVETYAVEMFVEKMVNENHDNAKKRGRNTVKYVDLAEVRASHSNMSFLNTLIGAYDQ